MSTFRHMLLIRFKDGVTDQQKTALRDEFARMPQAMDWIRRYEFGPDLGNLGPDAPDFGLIADFDSEDDWRRYITHHEHEALGAMVKEAADELIRMQYLVD